MSAATIRALRAEEADIARHVTNEAFRRYLALMGRTPENAPNPYDYFEEAAADGRAWVAEVAGEIVGVAEVAAKPDGSWSIDLVGVLEGHAGSGIGAALMARIEEQARARGVPRLILITLEKAEHLWRFYQRLAFVITDRALPAHGLEDFIRVHMEKKLTL